MITEVYFKKLLGNSASIRQGRTRSPEGWWNTYGDLQFVGNATYIETTKINVSPEGQRWKNRPL